MKTINLICINLIMILFVSQCQAQTILPLNTNILAVSNGSYLKDTNNELLQFTGTYNATYGNKEISLYITKQENKLTKVGNLTFYRDVLVVKYLIKENNQVLQDTQINQNNSNGIYSIKLKNGLNSKTVALDYEGTTCRVGQGLIYLKKINSTQLSWEYLPQEGYSKNCPAGTDTTIYLPIVQGLIFTKQ